MKLENIKRKIAYKCGLTDEIEQRIEHEKRKVAKEIFSKLEYILDKYGNEYDSDLAMAMDKLKKLMSKYHYEK